jgi:hypothetical protein
LAGEGNSITSPHWSTGLPLDTSPTLAPPNKCSCIKPKPCTNFLRNIYICGDKDRDDDTDGSMPPTLGVQERSLRTFRKSDSLASSSSPQSLGVIFPITKQSTIFVLPSFSRSHICPQGLYSIAAALGRRSTRIYCTCSFHFRWRLSVSCIILFSPSCGWMFSFRTRYVLVGASNGLRNFICATSIHRSSALPRVSIRCHRVVLVYLPRMSVLTWFPKFVPYTIGAGQLQP